jgi:hypothetical protein
MHNRSKHNCIILKDGVNDPWLSSAGKVGLRPFWTWVQVLSYVHVLQLFVGTFVSSFWHERTSTGGKIYTKMQMQGSFSTRNQSLANAYIWLQYDCFGCIWIQLHRSLVVDRWLQLERCNSLRQP